MKRVSFKVAKALKEAGYPQGNENTAYYNENGVLIKPFLFYSGTEVADAPTYLEVWRWLWREKEIRIELNDDHYHTVAKIMNKRFYGDDPEEAISNAIDYLIDNNLIK